MAKSYSDFFAALRQRESSNDYTVVNTLGFLGAYQFGELALIDLGYYTRDGTGANNWQDAFFTGKNGINSKADFLASPEVQDAAAAEWFALLWSYIRALDLEFYAGQVLNGVKLTKSGMIAAAHLAGAGGLRSFIESGGTVAPGDAYGTSLVDYLTLFEGYETPASFLDNHGSDNMIAGGDAADRLKGFSGMTP